MVQSHFALNIVEDSFHTHFDDGLELGAALAVFIDGACVADLWGGFTDAAKTRPWRRDTLINVWSTGKSLVALAIAMEVDRGHIRYTDKVAEHWPDFAQAGKADITIDQVMSHQAGLNAFAEDTGPDDILDWDLSVERLAAQAPFWEPGTDQGYGALTYGFVAGEIIRRVTGKSIGTYVREEITEPLGVADLVYVGLPPSEHDRVAELIKPRGVPKPGTGERTPDGVRAFTNPPIDANRPNDPAYREAEIPSSNTQASAFGLARIFAELAQGGGQLLSADTLNEATRMRTHRTDRTLRQPMCWAAGFLCNRDAIYGSGEHAFGHSGFGGSFVFADPDRKLAVAYVMNRMDINLFADPRSKNLIGSVYEAMG